MSGRLAIVLHTHMPYVEGFDTWPFGEEWLWEAIATSYLPLLDVLEETGAPVTLSLTPVLCDQLAAPGALDRCLAFLRDLRPESHRLDLAEQPPELRPALERSAADYERAAERLDDLDLLAALAPHAAWTSSATHAVLPLVATDAGARLQVLTGIESHRRRFARWRGGFWLPECAHAPWLDDLLEDAGVHATCVDLTDVLGAGSRGHLRPLRTEAGVLLVPLDRQTIELVWSDHGYPADGAYRDYHRRTRMDHRPWAIDGSPYDPDRALALARDHAADFVARALVRSREVEGGEGLVVCALDTELLGHWWYEGPHWLRAVTEECEHQGLELVHLDDALEDCDPAPAPAALPTTSWGSPRDLSTWEGPGVQEFAWRARRAELDLIAAGRAATPRAVRELLALQSSDWAFLVQRDLAAAYGHARADGHRTALAQELSAVGSGEPQLRNLAPYAGVSPLLT